MADNPASVNLPAALVAECCDHREDFHTQWGCAVDGCSCVSDPVGDRLAAQSEHMQECRDREGF